MEEIVTYKCSICGFIRDSKEKTLQCENSHKMPSQLEIKHVEFDTRCSRNNNLPDAVTLVDDSGNEQLYRKW